MASAAGEEQQPKPWGYLATFAWAVAAFIAGQIAALSALVLWRHGDVASLRASPYDGAVVTLSVLVLNPVAIAILMFAVGIRGGNQTSYFALVRPRLRDLVTGLVGIVVIIALTDVVLYGSGRAIVSEFQTDSYQSAIAEGWLVPLWISAVLVAPTGEELMFRGFLYRGFVRSERAAWPAIVVISLLWAMPHLQYDWTGILEIFIAGLFLGWMRWRSGSTLLTILLHGIFNLEGMFETLVQVRHG